MMDFYHKIDGCCIKTDGFCIENGDFNANIKGPTKFIAGSHLAGRPPNEGDHSAYRGMPDQSLLVSAGDCVMFRSDVWHRGGGNTCGEQRHIIQNHYCSRWLAERFQEGAFSIEEC